MFRPSTAWRRRHLFAVAGALLALGAPAGLIWIRSTLAGVWPAPEWIAAELEAMGPVYAYVALSTLVVFAAFGWRLGRLQDRVLAASLADSTTGLANRRHFEARLDEEIARVRRGANGAALLIVDVDHLKLINDELGHQHGDVAIRAVADALRATGRKQDMAARWGGDEFAVLLPETNLEEAVAAAERLRARVQAARPVRHDVPLTVSIGVAALDVDAPDAAELVVAAADGALYEAKAAGRNRVAAAQPARDAGAARIR
jgi:diguanylate cyclase (GGDEF)-like protein